MLGIVLATVLVLSGTQPVLPSSAVDLVSRPDPEQLLARPKAADAIAPPDPEQVLALPQALRDQFQEQVLSRSQQQQRRMDLLVAFLFHPAGLGMVYKHDATYTVAQAYQTRTANCLTFTLLTVALAREAGLDAYGQQIPKSLAWRREGNTIYRTIHVNAGIRVGKRPLSVDVASDEVISSDPPEKISDARLLAHYYNNRSVELSAIGQIELAQQYLERSLKQDVRYATTWSNAGVLHLRAGNTALSEQDYRHALELDPEHPSALINMSAHFQRIGEPARATPYIKRLEVVQARDPLHQFILGLDSEKQGDFRKAVAHYRRAIRLYGGEHQFHSSIARVYTQLGDTRRAQRASLRAQQLIDADAANRFQREAGRNARLRNVIDRELTTF
jgi:tetratricopeptide (TPR) repeat protein